MAQKPSEALQWGRRRLQSSGGTRLHEADFTDSGKPLDLWACFPTCWRPRMLVSLDRSLCHSQAAWLPRFIHPISTSTSRFRANWKRFLPSPPPPTLVPHTGQAPLLAARLHQSAPAHASSHSAPRVGETSLPLVINHYK